MSTVLSGPSQIVTRAPTGEAPESAIARDMVRRAVPVAAVLIAVSTVGWGMAGMTSSAFAAGLVVVNFLASAWLLATTARISYALLMGAALGGYLIRMGIIAGAVFAVRDAGWVELVPLGLTLVVAHLGLLFWELRYVSMSLAFPGLKPMDGNNKEIAPR